MRIYRVSWHDIQEGNKFHWLTSEVKAKAFKKALPVDDETKKAVLIELVNVPTAHNAMTDWLNANLSHGLR